MSTSALKLLLLHIPAWIYTLIFLLEVQWSAQMKFVKSLNVHRPFPLFSRCKGFWKKSFDISFLNVVIQISWVRIWFFPVSHFTKLKYCTSCIDFSSTVRASVIHLEGIKEQQLIKLPSVASVMCHLQKPNLQGISSRNN